MLSNIWVSLDTFRKENMQLSLLLNKYMLFLKQLENKYVDVGRTNKIPVRWDLLLPSKKVDIQPKYFKLNLTLSLTALGPISPISFTCHMLKKFLSGMKAILHVFLF
jgi:hypothetical protein